MWWCRREQSSVNSDTTSFRFNPFPVANTFANTFANSNAFADPYTDPRSHFMRS
jgi:hypothetical protein